MRGLCADIIPGFLSTAQHSIDDTGCARSITISYIPISGVFITAMLTITTSCWNSYACGRCRTCPTTGPARGDRCLGTKAKHESNVKSARNCHGVLLPHHVYVGRIGMCSEASSYTVAVDMHICNTLSYQRRPHVLHLAFGEHWRSLKTQTPVNMKFVQLN